MKSAVSARGARTESGFLNRDPTSRGVPWSLDKLWLRLLMLEAWLNWLWRISECDLSISSSLSSRFSSSRPGDEGFQSASSRRIAYMNFAAAGSAYHSQRVGQASSSPCTRRWRHYGCTSRRRAESDHILPMVRVSHGWTWQKKIGRRASGRPFVACTAHTWWRLCQHPGFRRRKSLCDSSSGGDVRDRDGSLALPIARETFGLVVLVVVALVVGLGRAELGVIGAFCSAEDGGWTGVHGRRVARAARASCHPRSCRTALLGISG